MSEKLWETVDDYLVAAIVGSDPHLSSTLAASSDSGLPPIQVSTAQGELLSLLVQVQGARRVLEIGTLGGYSTICMARELPVGGRLVSLEFDAKHADVARANISNAGLSDVVEVRVGAALDSLPLLANEETEPFDFFFIDADKANNPNYFSWAVKLSRPGSVIVVDNVVRDGAVIDADTTDPNIVGTRRLFDVIAAEPKVRATAIQTVGSKGYDGFVFARVMN
ncbi:MAG TPA: O-methyltransferase [Actinomycetes bacterium]|nr:O-methyltransferase [Actinomycetes bacterium]